jgi:hypothetical protein
MSSSPSSGTGREPALWTLDASTPPNRNAGQDGEKKKKKKQKQPRNNAATGASAAGFRAVTAQFVAFYFRAPMKAFFRTRVEYDFQSRLIELGRR